MGAALHLPQLCNAESTGPRCACSIINFELEQFAWWSRAFGRLDTHSEENWQNYSLKNLNWLLDSIKWMNNYSTQQFTLLTRHPGLYWNIYLNVTIVHFLQSWQRSEERCFRHHRITVDGCLQLEKRAFVLLRIDLWSVKGFDSFLPKALAFRAIKLSIRGFVNCWKYLWQYILNSEIYAWLVTFQPAPGRIQKLAKFLSSNSIKLQRINSQYIEREQKNKNCNMLFMVVTQFRRRPELCHKIVQWRVGQNCFWKQNAKQHFIITTTFWWRYTSYGTSGEQIETKLRPARLLLERGRSNCDGFAIERDRKLSCVEEKAWRILIHVRLWVSQVTEWLLTVLLPWWYLG